MSFGISVICKHIQFTGFHPQTNSLHRSQLLLARQREQWSENAGCCNILHSLPHPLCKGQFANQEACWLLELPNFSKGYCAWPKLSLFLWGGAQMVLGLLSSFLSSLLFPSLEHSPSHACLVSQMYLLLSMYPNHSDHFSFMLSLSCRSLIFSGTVHWFEGRQAFIHYCGLHQVWREPGN